MVELGKLNTLEIIKETGSGFYLDGGVLGEILLPFTNSPLDIDIGDELEVFIYLDSEDRIIATTQKVLGAVGEFVMLKVKQVNNVGAFLDWGLDKDLLVPYSEQRTPLQVGREYLVAIYLDRIHGRITATTKLDRHVDNTPARYKIHEQVEITPVDPTDLGYKVIVNNSHWGVVYKNEMFKKLNRGEKQKAYIQKVREDGKIDILLNEPGHGKVSDFSQVLLSELNKHGGFMPVTDKTDPETIARLFGVSKKTFKSAVGQLFKKGIIDIVKTGNVGLQVKDSE
ncbi:S1-like domain-containing RNA-binding protein [Moritella sp.]|uniref:CvfB family protein n=1 Tax=Moritella sp. TaxID=78556 RepID=UPI0025EC9B1C|nr:S1-like domain-containing RNA-binding protein [Moritella sp.]MCJ8350501.1 S1-like domain-containing RNA-binding protein [Moritella sp.]